MLSPSDRIVDCTLEYTLRPKGNNREKVIAAALEFVIEEFGYNHLYVDGGHGCGVVNVKDLQELIDELRDTVTLEELSQETPTGSPEAL